MAICPKCGTEIPDDANGCDACGYGASVKLKLDGCAGHIVTSINLDFCKDMGLRICGNDAKFMDNIQFRLRVEDEHWYIKPYPRIKNPVFINGSQIDSESILNDGDEISLKGKAAFINVKYI